MSSGSEGDKADRNVVIGPGVQRLLEQLSLKVEDITAVVQNPETEQQIVPGRSVMEGRPVPGKRVVVECYINADSREWHVVYAFEE